MIDRHTYDGKYDKALHILLRLRRKNVLQLISKVCFLTFRVAFLTLFAA